MHSITEVPFQYIEPDYSVYVPGKDGYIEDAYATYPEIGADESVRTYIDLKRLKTALVPFELVHLEAIAEKLGLAKTTTSFTRIMHGYAVLVEYIRYRWGACVWETINPKLFYSRSLSEFDDYARTCIGDLDTAMRNIGCFSTDPYLYRGVETPEEHAFFFSARVGDVFENGMFMSTSACVKVGMRFGNGTVNQYKKKLQMIRNRPVIILLRFLSQRGPKIPTMAAPTPLLDRH
jgi:hypothetical protein